MRSMNAEMRTGLKKCRQYSIYVLRVQVKVPLLQWLSSVFDCLSRWGAPRYIYFALHIFTGFFIFVYEKHEKANRQSKRKAMISLYSLRNMDSYLRGAAMMAVDFSRFGCLSGFKYEESLDEIVRVYVLKNMFTLENWSSLAIWLVQWCIIQRNYPHASLSIA